MYFCYTLKDDFGIKNFLQGNISYHLLRDLYEDLIRGLVDMPSEDNIFLLQPCRDNTLYLLRLVDEMLSSEIDHNLPVFNVPKFNSYYHNYFCLFSSVKRKRKKEGIK